MSKPQVVPFGPRRISNRPSQQQRTFHRLADWMCPVQDEHGHCEYLPRIAIHPQTKYALAKMAISPKYLFKTVAAAAHALLTRGLIEAEKEALDPALTEEVRRLNAVTVMSRELAAQLLYKENLEQTLAVCDAGLRAGEPHKVLRMLERVEEEVARLPESDWKDDYVKMIRRKRRLVEREIGDE